MKLPSTLSCDWKKAGNCVRTKTMIVVATLHALWCTGNAGQHARYFTVVKILYSF